MATTPNKNLNLPVYNSGNWDVPTNNSMSEIDTAFAGIQPINLAAYAGGTIVLTPTSPIVTTPLTSLSYLPAIIALSGAPAGAAIVEIPAGITGVWTIANAATGTYGDITISSGGGGSSYVATSGTTTMVYSDGTNINPTNTGAAPTATALVGEVKAVAFVSAPALWLLCYGQAISRTTYAALFAAIGTVFGSGDGSTTFNVPDLRGRVIAGADNMGGTAAGRLSGYTRATVGGAQSVTLTLAGIPAHTHADVGHTHGASDSGHAHGGGAQPNQFRYAGGSSATGVPGQQDTDTGYANVTIGTGYANLANAGSSGSHSNVQPTMALNYIIFAGV